VPPKISDKPFSAAYPGDRVGLSCSWPYPGSAGRLQWVNSMTQTVFPSEIQTDGNTTTAAITFSVDDSSLYNIFDCVVLGVTGKDSSILVDRVMVPVNNTNSALGRPFFSFHAKSGRL